MPRATRVLRAAERRDTSAVDTLILPHAQRQAQKGFLFGVKGIWSNIIHCDGIM